MLLVSQTCSATPSFDSDPAVHICTAVSVIDGDPDTLILPQVNSDCMQPFIDEVSSRHLDDRIIMVLDGAGWHKVRSLVVPDNMRLVSLQPYLPELNPVEHLWDELREKAFANLVFDSLNSLEGHLEISLRAMECDKGRAHSIVAWPWIINSFLI